MDKLNYQRRNETDAVVRLTDNFIIGPENQEAWEEYQNWLKEGNIPLPPEIIDDIPTEPTIEQKLASVGLSINDLKTALGI